MKASSDTYMSCGDILYFISDIGESHHNLKKKDFFLLVHMLGGSKPVSSGALRGQKDCKILWD